MVGTWLATATLAGLSLAVPASSAVAAKPPQGALTQLSGAGGCISSSGKHGCAKGRALGSAGELAVSADGRNVYIAANSSIAVFARNPKTQALTQLAGMAGCVGPTGCTHSSGKPAGVIVLSPDGRNLYTLGKVGNDYGVLAFARNPATGALTQLPGADGCVAEPDTKAASCGSVAELHEPADIVASPDGKELYVLVFGGVAVLDRNPSTGALRQPAAPNGCFAEKGAANKASDCAVGRSLRDVDVIAISHDGRNVYVAGGNLDSHDGSANIAVLTRNPAKGTLTQPSDETGCLDGFTDPCADGTDAAAGASVLVLSRDGTSAYLGNADFGGLISFTRTPSTGALTIQYAGNARFTPVLALSPDGKTLYAANDSGSAQLTVAARSASGTLKTLPGTQGCLASKPSKSCGRANNFAGVGWIAVSPDGRAVYVTSGNAVLAFARQR